jgi:hypothetical protein
MSDSHEYAAEESHDDWEEEEARPGDAPWPMRPVLFAGIGLAAAMAVHFLLGDTGSNSIGALTLAQVIGITVGAGLIGFTTERRHWWASLLFSLTMAALAAAVVWWNGTPNEWNAGEGWRVVSLFLAIAIAAPLFQAARDASGLEFRYAWVHDHAWTNIVLWFACWVFVGLSFAMLWMLAALFGLIKIEFLADLLRENWFLRGVTGLAFGAGLGVLRELDSIVRLLQRVVTTVLAVLAPFLAVGLILFLGSLPFTGLQALWDATEAATPILLACLIGALVLANSVIGKDEAEERQFPLLKWGAMGLGLVVLPLAVLAAIGTGMRIAQYGFTPERLWAATFVGIACVCGLAYLAALLLGRLQWAEKVRPANLGLALLIYVVALVLATPLISFNAISTADQVARLESGRTAPDKFDWAALQYDFGDPGKKAVEALRKSSNAAIRTQAEKVAKSEDRWEAQSDQRRIQQAEELNAKLRVLPEGAKIPDALRTALVDRWECRQDAGCTVLMIDANNAALLNVGCFGTAVNESEQPRINYAAPMPRAPGCLGRAVEAMSPNKEGKWFAKTDTQPEGEQQRAAAAGFKAGQMEVRSVTRRQVFVGGVPVGDAFE